MMSWSHMMSWSPYDVMVPYDVMDMDMSDDVTQQTHTYPLSQFGLEVVKNEMRISL